MTGCVRACALLVLACGALCAGLAAAAPPDGRLDPQERERLRYELRRQWHEDAGRSPVDRYERPQSPPADWAPRERGERPGYGYEGAQPPRGGGDWNRGEPRERMTPEERRQLRMQLRERHRSSRE